MWKNGHKKREGLPSLGLSENQRPDDFGQRQDKANSIDSCDCDNRIDGEHQRRPSDLMKKPLGFSAHSHF